MAYPIPTLFHSERSIFIRWLPLSSSPSSRSPSPTFPEAIFSPIAPEKVNHFCFASIQISIPSGDTCPTYQWAIISSTLICANRESSGSNKRRSLESHTRKILIFFDRAIGTDTHFFRINISGARIFHTGPRVTGIFT